MTLRQYLAFMTLGTVLCWVAWALVIYSADPAVSPWFIFFFFYASFFLALLGTFSLIGFIWRIWQKKHTAVLFRHVRKTFRQGILFSALLTTALLLQSQELLTWFTSMILILIFAIIESMFLSAHHPNRR